MIAQNSDPTFSFDGSTLQIRSIPFGVPHIVVEKYSQTTSYVDLSSSGLLLHPPPSSSSSSSPPAQTLPPPSPSSPSSSSSPPSHQPSGLASLIHFQSFPRLGGLSLADNNLTSLSSFPPLPKLKSLNLSRNGLADVHEMVTVLASKLPGLSELDSRMNPCCPHPRYHVDKTEADYNIYRNYVLSHLPGISTLDDVPVSKEERDAANAVGLLKNTSPINNGLGGDGDLSPSSVGSEILNGSSADLLHEFRDDAGVMRDPDTGALLTHEQALIRKRRSLHKIRREVTAAAAGTDAASASGSGPGDDPRAAFAGSRSLSMTTSSDFVETMLSSMDIVHYQAGDLIIRRGDVGSAMFFIISGRVEIILPDSESSSRANPTCSSGDFVGEIAMFLERKRTASVRAITEVDACCLTKDVCEAVLFQYPLIHHEFLMLAHNRLQADLEGSNSGAHETPEWMRRVASAVESMASPPGTPNGTGSSSSLALPSRPFSKSTGAINGASSSSGGGADPGSLHEQRRKLRMGALHRQFDEWDAEQNKNTSHRRKMKAHKRKWFSINLARGIDQYDIPKFLKEVLGSMITQHYDSGDYIVRQGERGSSMFFIARGVVDIEFDEPPGGPGGSSSSSTAKKADADGVDGKGGKKRENATLGAGEFFGEIAMFIEGKRTASVVARTDVDLSVLTKRVMDSVLAKYPMIKEEFVLLGQERLRKDQQWASVVGGEPKKPQNWMEKISRRAGTLFLKAKSGTADGSEGLPEGTLDLAVSSGRNSALVAALKSDRNEVISLMRQCYVLFDFEDPRSDPQGKAHKQRALFTLAEVYGSGTDAPIDEMEYPVLLSLLRANLLFERPRPKGYVSSLHANDFDFTDDPEPALLKSWPHVEVVYHIFKSFLRHPSFSVSLAKEYITRDFVAEIVGLLASHDADERSNVKDVLVVLYGTCTYLQRFLRDSIAHVVLTFVYENELHAGPVEIIQLVQEAGMVAHYGNPLSSDGRTFVTRVLFSLFKSAQLVRFTNPLLALISDTVLPLDGMPDALLSFLVHAWPKTSAAKEELFLRQVELIFETLGVHSILTLGAGTRSAALAQIAKCIESPQLHVAERALTLLGSDPVLALVSEDLSQTLPILIGPLYRNSRSHWDRYINSLTYDRLQTIMELDRDAFASALQDYALAEKAAKKDAKARASRWAALESGTLPTTGPLFSHRS